jgi:hypothetical protein
LQQFKRLTNAPVHRFVVFSIISDDNEVIPKFVQCNNCGVIHKVTDIGKSEIISSKEHMSSIITLEEIKSSIPEKLAAVLESNNCDLPTWEAAAFIIENKQWGNFVVLSSDEEGGTRQGKYVKIISESLLKVESFTREEVV